MASAPVAWLQPNGGSGDVLAVELGTWIDRDGNLFDLSAKIQTKSLSWLAAQCRKRWNDTDGEGHEVLKIGTPYFDAVLRPH